MKLFQEESSKVKYWCLSSKQVPMEIKGNSARWRTR